jgi:hypothetical protein
MVRQDARRGPVAWGWFAVAGLVAVGCLPDFDGSLGDCPGDDDDDAIDCPGDGTYTVETYAGGMECENSFVEDVDGDGHDDIIWPHQLDAEMRLWWGDGMGGFDTSTVGIGRSGGYVDFGDVDNDGYVDAIASNQDYSRLVLVRGDGDRSFGGETSDIGQGSFPTFVQLIDTDHDGNLDVFVSLSDQGCVALRMGNGDGTFDGANCTIDTDAHRFYTLDIDGDGWQELVQSNTGTIYGFDEDGDVDVVDTLDHPGFSSVGNLLPADIDRDGDPDLIAFGTLESDGTAGIAKYINDGAGSFYECLVASSLEATGTAAGDLNEDGQPDYTRQTTTNSYSTFYIHTHD